MKNQNKTFNHYLLKGQFQLVFNDNQGCKYLMTILIDKKNLFHGQIT